MVASASIQTFAVNAAFLQEIKDSSPDFQRLRREVHAACHRRDSNRQCLGTLVDRLNEWRDLLAVYFSLEETYGYVTIDQPFPGSGVTEPGQPHALGSPSPPSPAEVRDQHGELYLSLSDLVEEAEELQYRGLPSGALDELVNRTLLFIDRLDEHERAEGDLIGLRIRV